MIYGGKDEGVEAYVQQLGQELENTMMMTGVSSLREISKRIFINRSLCEKL